MKCRGVPVPPGTQRSGCALPRSPPAQAGSQSTLKWTSFKQRLQYRTRGRCWPAVKSSSCCYYHYYYDYDWRTKKRPLCRVHPHSVELQLLIKILYHPNHTQTMGMIFQPGVFWLFRHKVSQLSTSNSSPLVWAEPAKRPWILTIPNSCLFFTIIADMRIMWIDSTKHPVRFIQGPRWCCVWAQCQVAMGEARLS